MEDSKHDFPALDNLTKYPVRETAGQGSANLSVDFPAKERLPPDCLRGFFDTHEKIGPEAFAM